MTPNNYNIKILLLLLIYIGVNQQFSQTETTKFLTVSEVSKFNLTNPLLYFYDVDILLRLHATIKFPVIIKKCLHKFKSSYISLKLFLYGTPLGTTIP